VSKPVFKLESGLTIKWVIYSGKSKDLDNRRAVRAMQTKRGMFSVGELSDRNSGVLDNKIVKTELDYEEC
jgi:hypothetical protein